MDSAFASSVAGDDEGSDHDSDHKDGGSQILGRTYMCLEGQQVFRPNTWTSMINAMSGFSHEESMNARKPTEKSRVSKKKKSASLSRKYERKPRFLPFKEKTDVSFSTREPASTNGPPSKAPGKRRASRKMKRRAFSSNKEEKPRVLLSKEKAPVSETTPLLSPPESAVPSQTRESHCEDPPGLSRDEGSKYAWSSQFSAVFLRDEQHRGPSSHLSWILLTIRLQTAKRSNLLPRSPTFL